jgi:peptidoglycan/xylan/chitin deacetylase (PgdA/CDA1 family)
LADLAQELEGASDRAHGVDSKWVVLTHDIDTKESLKNLPRFLEIEREFGARSTNFVVPCSWRLDNELLGDVLASGNEIGIHGYDHSNRTAFLPPAEIRSRLESSRDFAERFQARGYRAPSLLRTPRLIEALAEFVDYDASVPNVDGFYSSRPGGCATSRPYHHVCGLAEIPLTLPSDANLLFQRFTPDEILSLWKKLALLILRSGGLVTVLTHCEERYSGNRGMHGIYSRFLDFIGSSCLGSWKTMGDVANSMAPDERSQSSRKK